MWKGIFMVVKMSASVFKSKLHRDKGRFVIDVRTEEEYNAGHVIGAHHYPLDELDYIEVASKLLDEKDLDDCVYILCQSGKRAEIAAFKLESDGGLEVIIIEGGTQACKKIEMAISKPVTNVIALERQVRILAGILVVLGSVLGFTLNANFYFISAAVGVGLLFSGVSGVCLAGLFLMKMPWSK
jgi:rhodanese-related sulfurtransferase